MKWNHVILFSLMVNVALSGQADEGTLLSNWKLETLAGSSLYNNTYNEVWGLAVNGSEYAIIGSTAGTHFINVNDPSNPVEDFFLQGASFGPHIVHRDFHDYKGYLYIIADEDLGSLKSRMQIVDISMLPEKIDLVYDSDEHIRKAHNIFIDTSQSKLYAFSVKGGNDTYAPLRIYDIQDPLDPKQLGDFRFELDGISVGHYHDGFVRDNIAYLNAGNDGLVIADLTDAETPKVLTHLTASDYPESGYNHSGWLSEDGRHYFMADETWGTAMKVFDVSDPMNITISNSFNAESESEFSIAHNQIVHCNYLFTSYYYDGLQVYDIRDPENPERVLHYPTSNLPTRVNYEGAWGVYPFLPSGNILVSDMQNGLFIIKGFTDYCALSNVKDIDEINSISEIIPNPSTGYFAVKTSEPILNILIHDSAGRLVKKIDNISSNLVNVLLEDAGVYFASILTQASRETKKIIIQE